MAVNKNFVVKNGLEVATDVILANASTKNVGIGSTQPEFTLDVRGGIGATDINISGFATVARDLQVGTSGSVFYVSNSTNNVGVGTSVPNAAYTLDVRSSVSTGQTALYVYGDMRVTGDLNLDDITLDDASIQNLTVTDTLEVTGLSTFSSNVDINADLDVAGITTTNNLRVSGFSTFVGFSTFADIIVGGMSTFVGISSFEGNVSFNAGIRDKDGDLGGPTNGYILESLENIPKKGVIFDKDGYIFEMVKVRNNFVMNVKVTKK